MRVSQWMSPEPLTIPSDLLIVEALGEMRKKKVRRFPVVDNERLVGIITQSDIHAHIGPLAPGNARVSGARRIVRECMTANPATIGPDASLAEAAAEMYRRRISGLPVVAGDRLTGLITETDMFRAFVIMLGFTEGGGEIEFELDRPDHLLAQIRQRTGDMIVRNLLVYQDPRTGKMGVRMKLRGRELDPTRKITVPKRK